MAAQIARSEGPSGPNAEYLLKLAASLRDLGEDDSHVFDLETRIRRRDDP
jgi:cation transport protein ChaC